MDSEIERDRDAGRLALLRRLRGQPDRPERIPGRAAGAVVPATPLQEGLWFVDRLAGPGGNVAYNVPLALRLRGPLDPAALRDALSRLVARHEILRTTFPERDGAPTQIVQPAAAQPLEVVDLGPVAPADRAAAADRLVHTLAGRPFDLTTGPLFSTTLIRLGADEHVLFVAFHHIVADGWSVRVFLDELGELYRAGRTGRQPALGELPIQYADYAVWQTGRLRGPAYDDLVRYWTGQLAGAPALMHLPTDRPRPVVPSFRGREHGFRLDAELVDGLRALNSAERVTTFMTVLAALQMVLARHCGQPDVVVGSPVAGRRRPELEPLIGMFLNTVVLRGDLSGEPSFRTHLRRTRATVLSALEHQELPFDHVVRHLRPERSPGYTPFLQVVFDLLDVGRTRLDWGDVGCEVRRVDAGDAKFDLMLDIEDGPDGISGTFGYRTDLFEPATVERLRRHLVRTLAVVVADPDVAVTAVDLTTPAERNDVVSAWNATGAPAGRSVPELFAERAAEAPDRIAVSAGDTDVTYGALAERVGSLVSLLRRHGAGPETRIGVCLHRTPDLAVAVLATLAAGAVYVPMDPELPAARLAYLAADAGVEIVLTTSDVAGAPDAPAVVQLDAATAPPSGPAPGAGAPVAAQLAYLMYTSGSTGVPKAAANTHGGLASHLAWVQRTYRLTPADRVLLKTPLSFDDSVRELFWPLTTGARLVLAPPGLQRDPAGLLQLIDEAGVTVLHVVPSLLRAVVDTPAAPGAGRTLRLVMSGGEALDDELQRRCLARFTAPLVNHYGPSETTIDVTRWTCREGDGTPIGRPGDNTRLYVLDRRGEPVAVGLPGELYVAGAQVGRGYLGRPGQTAEAFLPDPFAPEPGRRMYRTGDLARWRDGGVLDFLGRRDDQVKIRGYRVEPAEIEHRLTGQPGIVEAAVVVREDRPGDQRLVAYCATRDATPDWSAVRRALADHLPWYQVPASFVRVAALPRTPAGKLARRALPAPGPDDRAAVPYQAPRTPTETIVAAAWGEVFGVSRVGVHDDFFDSGGHSLLAVRLVARLRDALQVDVAVNAVFLAPSVAALADRISGSASAESAPIPVIDRTRHRVAGRAGGRSGDAD
ncbi:non-ribosomal peptide synthetase [Paractinoplanes rishiriensis]|uniref:non-ribosomal peptide synthetase n=1 Tax=Paractinoplanes rishiriensis TaxID=1050105 RepID=UPI001941FBAA|nr:non-ribosomal peptide synthetase [Actinoplanes rishiriensis]